MDSEAPSASGLDVDTQPTRSGQGVDEEVDEGVDMAMEEELPTEVSEAGSDVLQVDLLFRSPPAKRTILYSCYLCKRHMEGGWKCRVCQDYDLCIHCYKRWPHEHAMEEVGMDDERTAPRTVPQEALKELLSVLRAPSSPMQQRQVLDILQANPLLLAAFQRQRAAKHLSILNCEGVPPAMQGMSPMPGVCEATSEPQQPQLQKPHQQCVYSEGQPVTTNQTAAASSQEQQQLPPHHPSLQQLPLPPQRQAQPRRHRQQLPPRPQQYQLPQQQQPPPPQLPPPQQQPQYQQQPPPQQQPQYQQPPQPQYQPQYQQTQPLQQQLPPQQPQYQQAPQQLQYQFLPQQDQYPEPAQYQRLLHQQPLQHQPQYLWPSQLQYRWPQHIAGPGMGTGMPSYSQCQPPLGIPYPQQQSPLQMQQHGGMGQRRELPQAVSAEMDARLTLQPQCDCPAQPNSMAPQQQVLSAQGLTRHLQREQHLRRLLSSQPPYFRPSPRLQPQTPLRHVSTLTNSPHQGQAATQELSMDPGHSQLVVNTGRTVLQGPGPSELDTADSNPTLYQPTYQML